MGTGPRHGHRPARAKSLPGATRLRLGGMVAACALLLAGSRVRAEDDAPDRRIVLSGAVVDEAGHPVAGATVSVVGDEKIRPATTGDDGGFRLPDVPPIGPNSFIALYAEGRDGRLGVLNVGREKPEPLRIALKPTRELAVRVRDRDGMPVADAEVEALVFVWRLIGGRTDAEGRWVGRVPADGKFWTVSARKAGVGFDYANNVPAKGPRTP